jgi:hypothetical protein
MAHRIVFVFKKNKRIRYKTNHSLRRMHRLPSLRRSLSSLRSFSTSAATAASATSADTAIKAASSILSFSTSNVLQPGAVVVNLGAETEIGQVVTVAAAMRGVTTINVVGQGSNSGYPDSVSHMYDLGGDYVVTESFVGFRGFKELVAEVCGEGKSPALVINGSNLIADGTNALAPFSKAKSFTAKKSAIEDMQDNNMFLSASRVGYLGAVMGDAKVVKHSGSSYDGASSGSDEQAQIANELASDLSAVMAE